jgi:micrococcal nuclease
MRQQFQCPRCKALIDYGTRFCIQCGQPLVWQQPSPPPAQYQQQYQQQAPPSYQQQVEPPKKKTNVWLFGCLGLIVLAVIIGGISLAVGTSSPTIPSTTTPPATTPNQSTPPTTESTTEPEPSTEFTEAKVVRVIDGDTIEVNIAGKTYKVRYIGIDTPETVHPSKPVEYMGQEASDKNKELVDGKTVKLEKDISETDKYDRLLRYVYVGDLFINAELVRLGYAQVSTYPPDVKYQDLFLQLQQEARDAERGLWAAQPQEPEQTSGKYVGSIKSDKYHYPWCSAAKKILPENLIWFDSAADAQSQGYSPCGICDPPTTD